MKIKCRLTFTTHNKIAAIKVIREATNFGLKEAKDFCDLAFSSVYFQPYRHPLPIILTAQQFGILEIRSRLHPEGPLLSISDISIFFPVEVLDLSNNVRED